MFQFHQRQKLISSPKYLNWLWDELSHLFNGIGIFPGGTAAETWG